MKNITIKNIKQKIDCDYLQSFFQKKYNLSDLYPNYFNYVLTWEILEIEKKYLTEIKKITKQIDKIFLKWYKFYLQNIWENLVWDKSFFIEYLKKDFKKEEYLIWRYDVLIDKKWVLKFIEINANTPWMITDIYNISKLLKQKWYKNISSHFPSYIKNTFKNYKWKKIWILLPHSYSDEDFLVCLDYKDILKDIFWEENIIIWDIFESNIVWNEIFTLKWEKIDVIINFFPLEFFLTDIDFAKDFFNIVKNNKVKLFNNIESIILQDKLMFAVIWENIKKYSKIEQKLIKKHIPFSTRIFQENDEKFVAKYRWGRISNWVFDKDFYSNIENKKDFIFQEKVFSNILQDWSFLVLWLFTKLSWLKAFISRKQIDFITSDEKVKIICVYSK